MSLPVARILCVDDDDDSCELMEIMLRQEDDGYEMTSASDARKALALIAGQSFDLYILDYSLPDTAGTELCRKIREIDSDTPIMFYTAMARPVDRQTAMAAGATEYLVKPNDLDRLTGTVRRLLNKKASVSRNESSSEAAARNGIY